MWEVNINLEDTEKIIDELGLSKGGKAQTYFTSEIMRLSDPYVPFSSSVLKNSARIDSGGDAIIYETPYARYHWYGKVMIDPITGKACMVYTDKNTGNVVRYSRPYVEKVLTSRDMKYSGAPIRGPFWCERSFIDNKEQIIKSLEAFVISGGK